MASPRPPDFSALIASVAAALRERGVDFMLIGGQAVLLHGRPRLTEDIDITLGVDPDALPRLLEVCAEAGLSPLPEDVDAFVRRTFVLPARHDETGMRVDFIPWTDTRLTGLVDFPGFQVAPGGPRSPSDGR